MADTPKRITETERIVNALNRLIAQWKNVLDTAIPRRPNEKVILHTALGLVITELARGPSAYVPRPEPDIVLEVYGSPAFKNMLNTVGSATEQLRNQAASEGVPLPWLENSMRKELDTRQKEFQPLLEKYQMDEDKRNVKRQTRTYEIFYQLALEAIKRFREYINQMFNPLNNEQSQWRDIRTPRVITVVWQKKTIPFVRKTTKKTTAPKKPTTTAKKYYCNAWNHKPTCTCGWGPRPSKGNEAGASTTGGEPGKPPPPEKPATVYRRVWIPLIYIYPVKPSLPVMI